MESESTQQLIEIYKLIGEGNKRIGDYQEKEAILILGKTGAGKSTLTYHLASAGELIAVQNDEGNFVIEAVKQVGEIKISHLATSETKIPNKIRRGDLVLWDCPGFDDTEGIVQEISNAFYIQRLFETTEKLKFVLAISEHSLHNRGVDLVPIVEQVERLFKNPALLEGSISLVITQVPPIKKVEHIKTTLTKIIEQNRSISESTRILIGYLLPSIHLFYTPSKEGKIESQENLLNEIDKSTKYITAEKEANVVISKKSMPLAQELFEASQKNLFESVDNLAKIIQRICEKVNHPDNLYYSEYGLISKGLNKLSSMYLKNFTKKHYRQLLELDDIFIFNEFCQGILSKNTTRNFLEYLNHEMKNLIQVLLRGTDDSENQEIEYVREKISENSEYVKFLELVCENKIINIGKCCEIVRQAKIAAEIASAKAIATIQLSEDEENELYYLKIIKYFEVYIFKRPEYGKTASEAYYHLGRISSKKKYFKEAVGFFWKSLSLNYENKRSSEGIDHIYFAENALKSKFFEKIEPDFQTKSKIISNLVNFASEKFKIHIKTEIIPLINFLLGKPYEGLSFTKIDNIPEYKRIIKRLETIENMRAHIDITCNNSSKDYEYFQEKLFLLLKNEFDEKRLVEIQTSLSKKYAYIKFLDQLIGKNQSDNQWKVLFRNLGFVDYLITQIKQIKPNFQSKDIEYYKMIASLSNLDLNLPSQFMKQYSLKDFLICKNNCYDCYFQIAQIYQQNEKYELSGEYFQHAVKIKSTDYLLFEKINEFYWKHNKIPDSIATKEIMNALLNYNQKKISGLITNKFKNLVSDYCDKREFYQKYSDSTIYSEIFYIKDHMELARISEKISAELTTDKLEFIDNLKEIYDVLKTDIKIDYKFADVVMEIQNESDYFTQLIQISKTKNLMIDLENILKAIKNALKSVLNPCTRSFVLNRLKSFTVEQTSDENYYSEVINLAEFLYPCEFVNYTEKLFTCFCSIAEILKSKNKLHEALDFYLVSLKYNPDSIKIAEKIGKILIDLKNYDFAIAWFRNIGSHINMDICFKIMIQMEPENFDLREFKGDVMAESGRIDKAVKCYNEALSLNYDEAYHRKVYKKIGRLVYNSKTIGEEFYEKNLKIDISNELISKTQEFIKKKSSEETVDEKKLTLRTKEYLGPWHWEFSNMHKYHILDPESKFFIGDTVFKGEKNIWFIKIQKGSDHLSFLGILEENFSVPFYNCGHYIRTDDSTANMTTGEKVDIIDSCLEMILDFNAKTFKIYCGSKLVAYSQISINKGYVPFVFTGLSTRISLAFDGNA